MFPGLLNKNKTITPRALVDAADMVDIIKLVSSFEGQSKFLRDMASKMEEAERLCTEAKKVSGEQHKENVDMKIAQQNKLIELQALEKKNRTDLDLLASKEVSLIEEKKSIQRRESAVIAREADLSSRIVAFEAEKASFDLMVSNVKSEAEKATAAADKARRDHEVATEKLNKKLADIARAAGR